MDKVELYRQVFQSFKALCARGEQPCSFSAYLQSSTMGTSSTPVKGEITETTVTKRTIYALSISGTTASVVSSAGRATGLMIRPVKYLRVE